jgi:hypothetical protein
MALANSYLDVTELKARTIAPASLVDGLHLPAGADRTAWEEFVEHRLVVGTSEINARLRKRYAVPFEAPVPEMVLAWLTAIVTPKLYERRGWDPSDAQAVEILAEAERSREQMKEAADSEIGLYDLPLLNDVTTDGISKGGPFGYAEASPYSAFDVQVETIRGGGV